MSRCGTLFIALSLALLSTLPGLCGEPPQGVTTADPDARQLQALGATEAKLAALGGEQAQQKHPATAKGEKKRHRKVHPGGIRGGKRGARQGKVQAPPKVTGRRLTDAEVKQVLATTRDFAGCDLSGLNLSGRDLSRTHFNRASLKGANLERADLSECDFELADLSGAKLSRATLDMARLYGTKMEGARLDGALWIDGMLCRSGSLGRCLQ